MGFNISRYCIFLEHKCYTFGTYPVFVWGGHRKKQMAMLVSRIQNCFLKHQFLNSGDHSTKHFCADL